MAAVHKCWGRVPLTNIKKLLKYFGRLKNDFFYRKLFPGKAYNWIRCFELPKRLLTDDFPTLGITATIWGDLPLIERGTINSFKAPMVAEIVVVVCLVISEIVAKTWNDARALEWIRRLSVVIPRLLQISLRRDRRKLFEQRFSSHFYRTAWLSKQANTQAVKQIN